MMVKHRSPSFLQEVVVRLGLVIFFFYTDKAEPLFRKIQPEEYWLYRFPRTPSFYPSFYLWCTLIFTPPIVIGLFFVFKKDLLDLKQAFLGAVLSIFLAGDITNIIKLGVGRPRPDFLARCFPDGNIKDSMKCNGDLEAVLDGYKSFPSGHSASMIAGRVIQAVLYILFTLLVRDHTVSDDVSFSCLGYLALYIAGKLHCLSPVGRGDSCRLLAAITPLVWATMIAVSRTIDYHHHWQDVTVGSLLGMVVAFLCYRQYYPPIQRINSHLPYAAITPSTETEIHCTDRPLASPTADHSDRFEQLMKTV